MQQPNLRWFQQFPLQPVLIVPFLLQISVAVGLVGYLSFKNGQKAVNELVGELVDKASQQVGDHLDGYLALSSQLAEINSDAIANKEIDLDDPVASGRYFWRQAKAFKNLNYIGYALTDGREAGAGHWVKGVDLLLYENLGQGQALDYVADQQGNRAQLLQRYNYDPLSERWYQDAVATGGLIRGIEAAENSEVNVTAAGSSVKEQDSALDGGLEYYIAVSTAAPLYDKNRQLLGVTSIELALTSISDFLRRLNLSPSGQVFVMERNGLLVANSSNHPILHKVDGTVKQFSVSDSPDPLIRAVAQTLQQRFNTFEAIQGTQELNVLFDGQRQFVQVSPWQDEFGLDWLVIVTVPESDFMTQINANTKITILLCVAAAFMATVSGFLTSRWIARPILRLSQLSEAVAKGQQQTQQLKFSGIRELDTVSQSFNHMAQQLQASFDQLVRTNAELESRVKVRTAELQTALENLQRTQAQMVQSEKMSALGQMVAGVAHEINNPVNFIHGNLSYVNEYSYDLLHVISLYQNNFPDPPPEIADKLAEIDFTFLEEDLTKVLQSMYVGTERIRDIVLSLRNFSRLDEAEFKAADIRESIDSTLMILHHRLKSRPNQPQIQVVKEYSELPLVECYVGQLNQVFMNLISNAIDTLEERDQHRSFREIKSCPSMIRIRVEVLRAGWISIQVIDNGAGMSEEIRSRIFDPFFTTKPVGQGTGLGLSISYQIVTEKHGGKLWCDSEPGQGTKFVVEIPVRQKANGVAQSGRPKISS